MGRPSSYTDEIADTICDAIAQGRGLEAAVTQTPGMPSARQVHRWIEDDVGGFRQKYARARSEQADHDADAIIEIADTVQDASIARNMIDARKWRASKLAPKKYGERTILAGDEDAPLAITAVERVIVRPGRLEAPRIEIEGPKDDNA